MSDKEEPPAEQPDELRMEAQDRDLETTAHGCPPQNDETLPREYRERGRLERTGAFSGLTGQGYACARLSSRSPSRSRYVPSLGCRRCPFPLRGLPPTDTAGGGAERSGKAVTATADTWPAARSATFEAVWFGSRAPSHPVIQRSPPMTPAALPEVIGINMKGGFVQRRLQTMPPAAQPGLAASSQVDRPAR